MIYGYRRRKHNSDSDTNDEEESSDDSKVFNEGLDDDSNEDDSDGKSDEEKEERSHEKQLPRRRMNVAKFLERENLSETEMRDLSNSSTDTSSESESDDSSSSSSSSSSSNKAVVKVQPNTSTVNKDSVQPIKTKPSEEDFPSFSTNQYQHPSNSLFSLNTMNNNNFINFKEFSVQLLSNFSSLNQQQTFAAAGLNSSHGSGCADEFIDNEIYKIVLNGGGKDDLSASTGGLFEMNPKEAFEIEELGKKIATFQIETDDDEADDEEEEKNLENKTSVQPTNKEDSRATKNRIKSSNLYDLYTYNMS